MLLSTVNWLSARSKSVHCSAASSARRRPATAARRSARPAAGSRSCAALDDLTDLVGRHRVAPSDLAAPQRCQPRHVGSDPAPPLGLGQRGAQHTVATADGRRAHARPTHTGVPALYIAYAEAGDRHAPDRVIGNRSGATCVVSLRRLGPHPVVGLAPQLEYIGDGTTRSGRMRARLQTGGDALSLTLRAVDGLADLGGFPVRVTARKHPYFPDAAPAFANRCHGPDGSSCRDGSRDDPKFGPSVPSPDYGIRTPEMARAITRRWISEVPSKIV